MENRTTIQHKAYLKKKSDLDAKNKSLSQLQHTNNLKKNQQLILQARIKDLEIHLDCLTTTLRHLKRCLFAKRMAQAKKFLKKRAAFRHRMEQLKRAILLAQQNRQKQLEAETRALHQAFYNQSSISEPFPEETLRIHLIQIPQYYSPWRFFQPANEPKRESYKRAGSSNKSNNPSIGLIR